MELNYFDLLEEAKTLGLSVEHSIDWLYGEQCDCGCKFVVVTLQQLAVVKHCKTLKQVNTVLKHERAGLKPHVEKFEKWQQTQQPKIFEQLTLKVI